MNFPDSVTDLGLARGFVNSAIAVAGAVPVCVITSTLAGYAFAKFKFPGRDKLFMLYVVLLLTPSFLILIPRFLVVHAIKLTDTLVALMLDWWVSYWGIFFMRQYLVALPDEMLDAARIDGASEFQVFLRIVLPLSAPAYSVVALWAGLGTYNAFMWPFTVINKKSLYTIQLLLSGLGPLGTGMGAGLESWLHVYMAGITLSTLPMFVIVFILYRHLVRGWSMTAGMKA